MEGVEYFDIGPFPFCFMFVATHYFDLLSEWIRQALESSQKRPKLDFGMDS